MLEATKETYLANSQTSLSAIKKCYMLTELVSSQKTCLTVR